MTPSARLLGLILLAVAPPVSAKEWQMAKGSSLGFSSSFQGEAFNGNFSRFTPQIRFDPKRLPQARFDVSIDLASADTRNSERDDTLKTSDFFDVGKTPTARYIATSFKDLGNGRYQADGTLNLRGITKPVSLVFSWKPGQNAVLSGEATVNRLDYKVGSGDWSDIGILPNAVKVKTVLILVPKVPATP
ncbi:MAG: YceI family protein [Arenimonas sp.]|jgi:polyisoprenoid-binding protein YceI|uniref:YceI family protein n=1 Tax=Arenimonas sp. TaxID=1872635 RepID=UPI001B5CED87|nr:YceI family protein [Arenimonas sp.]